MARRKPRRGSSGAWLLVLVCFAWNSWLAGQAFVARFGLVGTSVASFKAVAPQVAARRGAIGAEVAPAHAVADDASSSTAVAAASVGVDERLLGTWRYAGGAYEIRRHTDGRIFFHEHSAGELRTRSDEWLQAELPAAGTIRLKLSPDGDTVVSTFKVLGTDTWGEQLFAFREWKTLGQRASRLEEVLDGLAFEGQAGDGDVVVTLNGRQRPTALRITPKAKVLVPIADDSEEIETACITDTLTRAGAAVTVASVMPALQVRMSHGLKIVADCSIEECKDIEWDAIALPGGMPGAERLRDCATLVNLLREHVAKGKIIAAVCASPAVVLVPLGILPARATCYPATKYNDLVPNWVDSRVVVDGHIVTSQGPGTSLQFALQIVKSLYGDEKADEIGKSMLASAE